MHDLFVLDVRFLEQCDPLPSAFLSLVSKQLIRHLDLLFFHPTFAVFPLCGVALVTTVKCSLMLTPPYNVREYFHKINSISKEEHVDELKVPVCQPPALVALNIARDYRGKTARVKRVIWLSTLAPDLLVERSSLEKFRTAIQELGDKHGIELRIISSCTPSTFIDNCNASQLQDLENVSIQNIRNTHVHWTEAFAGLQTFLTAASSAVLQLCRDPPLNCNVRLTNVLRELPPIRREMFCKCHNSLQLQSFRCSVSRRHCEALKAVNARGDAVGAIPSTEEEDEATVSGSSNRDCPHFRLLARVVLRLLDLSLLYGPTYFVHSEDDVDDVLSAICATLSTQDEGLLLERSDDGTKFICFPSEDARTTCVMKAVASSDNLIQPTTVSSTIVSETARRQAEKVLEACGPPVEYDPTQYFSKWHDLLHSLIAENKPLASSTNSRKHTQSMK